VSDRQPVYLSELIGLSEQPGLSGMPAGAYPAYPAYPAYLVAN
jgi:hypothetical protein